MQRDHEFEQFLRRSLHAAAESVAIGEDGLDRIRGRLAEVRRAAAADRGEPPAPRVAQGRLVLVGVSLVGREHW
jgi:hypothetical protein